MAAILPFRKPEDSCFMEPEEPSVRSIFHRAFALAAGAALIFALGGFGIGLYSGQSSGYESGYTAGTQSGYDEGHEAGYQAGYNAGLAEGTAAGSYDTGYSEGHAAGYQQGYDTGYHEGGGVGCDNGYSAGQKAALAASVSGSGSVSRSGGGGNANAGNADNFNTYDNASQQNTSASYVLNKNSKKIGVFHIIACPTPPAPLGGTPLQEGGLSVFRFAEQT